MHQLPDTPRSERGQSTVEFALITPLVVLCALVLLETLSLCLSVLSLNDTARNAVRSAITAQDPASAATAVAQMARVTAKTEVDEVTGFVTVTVHSRHKISTLALLRWLPSMSISAQSTMLREPPLILK